MKSFLKQLSGIKSVEHLVAGNECSVIFIVFRSLTMDRLSFVFSLLLIVSVTATFGSVIKAKNPTEKVILLMIKIFARGMRGCLC